jgi:hypothetical protein
VRRKLCWPKREAIATGRGAESVAALRAPGSFLVTFSAGVKADGSFSALTRGLNPALGGQRPDFTLKGTISGAKFTGELDAVVCVYDVKLERAG